MDEKNKIPGVSFIKRNIGTIIGLILLVIIVSISTHLNEKLNSGFGPNARVNSI